MSSFRVGDFPNRLTALAGQGRTVALVPNALDGLAHDVRRSGIARDVADLTAVGFDVRETDVRAPGAPGQLTGADVVWVRGGNVFVLRRVLADTGTDSLLIDLIERDAVVYAGYSARACVLAPCLDGLEQVDDVTVVDDPIYRGLAVLDRPLVPHVQSSGHPESAACDAVSARMTSAGTRHWALRDGDVPLVDGGTTELLRRGR